LKGKSDLAPAAVKLAAQLSEAARAGHWKWTPKREPTPPRRLAILERAARGEEFAQIFAQTSAIAKDREIRSTSSCRFL